MTIPFWQRFQFEIGGRWQLFPAEMTWRKWAFDPEFGVTRVGQEITSRHRLPDPFHRFVEVEGSRFLSKVLWVHGALRVLGLDVGVALFFMPRSERPGK